MIPLIVVAIALSLVAAMACFRVSEWHQEESDYWRRVHIKVVLSPELDAKYRPVLIWSRAHRPSLWCRLGGWRSPEERMPHQ